MNATCLNCKRTFDTERTDAQFCGGPCKADYHRAAGATGKHAEKERYHSKFCEYCGNMFWYNDYAARGGKREPTFCKDACRIAAWKTRRKGEAKHKQTAHENPRSWEAAQEKAKAKQEPPKQKAQSTGDFRDSLKAPSRWNSTDALLWLGVKGDTSEAACRKAWRELNAKYHPDSNNGAVWPHLVHINAAYDYLKRHVWKHSRR